MSHQHRIEVAPSPDYQQHDDLQPVQIDCRDCGDVEIQFVPLAEVADRIRRQRCDECQETHTDEVQTAKRVVRAHRDIIISKALGAAEQPLPQMVVNREVWPSRSRGPNDERSILCDECGEEAGTFIGYVGHLDGKAAVCPHCQTHGKIVVGDDEGSAHIRFRAYTAKEIASQ